MNPEQIMILNYLNNNAVGYNNRRSATEIRTALHLASGGPTNEHVRDLIRDMVFNHGCLIGSLMYKAGYWIIENEDELEMVLHHLRSRADGVRARAEALQRNWDEHE